jgi:hypothetical protein
VPRLFFESVLPVPPEHVARFHEDARALTMLAPPGSTVEVVGEATVREGALHDLRIRRFGLPLRWLARISEVGPHGFTDTAERSPFARWRHRHEWLPHAQGTLLRDTVEFEMPFGPLGKLAEPLAVRDVRAMFAHRHRVTREALTYPT